MVHVLQPQLAGDSWSSEENPREVCQEEALQSRYQGWNQCYVSGAGFGSEKFWASRIRSTVVIFCTDLDPAPVLSSTSKKFLIFEDWCKDTYSKTKLNRKLIFCWCLGNHWKREQDPDPHLEPDPSPNSRNTGLIPSGNIFDFSHRHINCP